MYAIRDRSFFVINMCCRELLFLEYVLFCFSLRMTQIAMKRKALRSKEIPLRIYINRLQKLYEQVLITNIVPNYLK